MQMLDQLFLDVQHALAGEYSLERELGRGGMGVVYLARDVQLDRLVAIKVLPRELAGLDETRVRFLREDRTAAQLFHPNIVPIFRVGEAAGLPYFVRPTSMARHSANACVTRMNVRLCQPLQECATGIREIGARSYFFTAHGLWNDVVSMIVPVQLTQL